MCIFVFDPLNKRTKTQCIWLLAQNNDLHSYEEIRRAYGDQPSWGIRRTTNGPEFAPEFLWDGHIERVIFNKNQTSVPCFYSFLKVNSI